MPQAVFDAFTAEYGIKVKYATYASGEEVVANLRAGKAYDVVAVEAQDIPTLIAGGLLAKNDPAIFPSNDSLKVAEILLPLGPKG